MMERALDTKLPFMLPVKLDSSIELLNSFSVGDTVTSNGLILTKTWKFESCSAAIQSVDELDCSFIINLIF